MNFSNVTQETMKFKINDKVLLNSGSPILTVVELIPDKESYICSWTNSLDTETAEFLEPCIYKKD